VWALSQLIGPAPFAAKAARAMADETDESVLAEWSVALAPCAARA
jgi:hypothetical protein